MEFRTEKDSLGEKAVPADVYYGIQTRRALENFPISGLREHPELIRATVRIKKAAARANMELGRLDPRIGEAIMRAADEMLAGALMDQVVVDVFQAGAGTSYNMNINEVLANRAIELLGGQKGDYSVVHPNDHVNMAQSTNDVVPTSIRLASLAMAARLIPALDDLRRSFERKSAEFDHVLKAGRTHLQDAVPIRLGQEFRAYADTLARNILRIGQAVSEMRELGIGGTAVGTGLNAGPKFAELMVRYLSEYAGEDFHLGRNLIELTRNMDPFLTLSGALRTLSADLIQITGDLRLLSSGPMTGLAEIRLPAVQPGSSIMPGKVNPVMAEMLGMVCFQVMGCDAAIALAAQAGQLELNVMMPLIAYDLLFAMEILTNALRAFDQRCVQGIEADEARCRSYAERTLGLAAALNPYIGYAEAAKVAQEALASGKSIRRVVEERGLLSPERLNQILSPWELTEARDTPERPSGAGKEAGP